MSARVTLTNAQVTRVNERSSRSGKSFLSLAVRASNKRGAKYENVNVNVTVFNPTFTPKVKDRVNVEGTLRIDSNPNWVQLRKEDVGNGGAKTSPSQWVEVVAFGQEFALARNGDPTTTKPKEVGREAFPLTDFDDDLGF